MTLGERIASLRKERGMSQETLGALVGVSRQAVSKWEADRAIPDVYNCVAISRAMKIPLAELLELEEEKTISACGNLTGAESAGADPADADPSGVDSLGVDPMDADLADAALTGESELSASQLRVVKQMIETYTAAQKKPRRRWRWPLILVGCALAVGVAWLWQWLTDMNRTIDYLHGEVAGLQGAILSEISGISEQVQAGLREENSLVTDYEIQVVRADLRADTITYELSVNLKEGNVNTRQQIMARCGDETWIAEMSSTGGLGFVGQLTCPLKDDTVIYLVIEEDGSGTTRSQRLEVWFPEESYDVQVDGWVDWASFEKDGLVDGAKEVLDIYVNCFGGPGLEESVQLKRAEIVVLRNREEIKTHPIDLSQVVHDEYSGDRYLHYTEEVVMEADMALAGDHLTFELRVWDNYDRYFSRILSQYRVQQGGKVSPETYEVYKVTE